MRLSGRGCVPRVWVLIKRKFLDAGPRSQLLSLRQGLAVMLLSLKDHQKLRAPDEDTAKTVFTVLSGTGFVQEGDTRHVVQLGKVVHVLPGERKALIAAGAELSILGVRCLTGKSR